MKKQGRKFYKITYMGLFARFDSGNFILNGPDAGDVLLGYVFDNYAEAKAEAMAQANVSCLARDYRVEPASGYIIMARGKGRGSKWFRSENHGTTEVYTRTEARNIIKKQSDLADVEYMVVKGDGE